MHVCNDMMPYSAYMNMNSTGRSVMKLQGYNTILKALWQGYAELHVLAFLRLKACQSDVGFNYDLTEMGNFSANTCIQHFILTD